MKRLSVTLVFCISLLVNSLQAERPSKESVLELLELTHADRIVDSTKGRLMVSINTPIQQAIGGRKLSEESKQVLEKFRARAIRIINNNISWDTVRPLLLEVYRNRLTQEEVDQMAAFFKSPGGKAFLEKVPELTAAGHESIQNEFSVMVERLHELRTEMFKKIEADLLLEDSPRS